jgi:molecular chaperone GrpE
MAKKKTDKAIVEETDDVTETEDTTTEVTAIEAETSKTVVEQEEEEEAKAEEGAEEEAAPSAEEDIEAEEVPSLEEQLELAQQEASKNLENWQRAAAELVNFKRRQEEQLKRQRDRIKSEVLERVLSALDDMDLAFQNVPEELNGQLIGWVEGFRLVQRKLDRILDDQNVMPISTEGKFDPNFHEAVSYEENEIHEEGDIIAELRKGYQIGNRIIRPALVRVAK